MLLEINPQHPEPHKIRRALKVFEEGGLVAYPTDTMYALGCAFGNKQAIDRLFRVTGKDPAHPLTFVCPDLSDIAKYAVVENPQYRILKRSFPGPYVFVLPATREVPRALMQKRKTIGLRIPSHPVALALSRALGVPILSTSANAQGEEPLADPAEIVTRFKGVELVFDAGLGGLVPSTMVDLTGPEPVVLRQGAGSLDGIL